MPKLLSALIMIFGIVCCFIAIGHIAIGPPIIPGAIPVNATMDSEDRFYATLFLGFGAALMWCSRDLKTRHSLLGALLVTFFLSGVSRIISVIAVGWPNHLFIFLGALELLLPPLFWYWYRFTQRKGY
jgi:hypothetical protein